ncbi:hypothetical protein K457DRAFT_26649 [Linnemannia elongata AG-77]|uniref:Uncharacterized protein n=1 Tax=Linnemannia elongata AG-77 TaxID=1314771 RepID=A0A197JBS6_9FUNG|nr:hypothetical protein K457DRAFT_26649 [Linnemannia elongata AG-77]
MANLISTPRSHADEAWKSALDVYFREFMQFFYQEIAAQIAWDAQYQTLDKELQSLSFQGHYEVDFAQRLFEYFYRLYDRYRQPVLTMAVLTDERSNSSTIERNAPLY